MVELFSFARVSDFHCASDGYNRADNPYRFEPSSDRTVEFARLRAAATRAFDLGLEVHAGHGLDYATAADMLAIAEVRELNIGHFLIGEAVFIGLTLYAVWRKRKADACCAPTGAGEKK